jgi:hypothetical protein
MGAVLMQEHDGNLHPVEFYSHSLDQAQRNYTTPDQELLAIILSLAHWRHLLEGAHQSSHTNPFRQFVIEILHDKPHAFETTSPLVRIFE